MIPMKCLSADDAILNYVRSLKGYIVIEIKMDRQSQGGHV